jgi:hypothetical protein
LTAISEQTAAPVTNDRFRLWLNRLTGTGETYALSRWLFLRALGIIYLIAFLSLAAQVDGLIGAHGVTPAADYLDSLAAVYPAPDRYLAAPTLAWLNTSDAFLHFLSLGGAALALLLILDLLTVPVLALLWLFYLSLVVAGQQFFAFQWDILLLEVGFLSIFFDSFHVLPRLSRQRAPSRVIIWLFRWLLFRLMFMSGVVKLVSGDPTWRSLTALSYHYWTQPLPTPLAWYMAQLPLWFMQLSTVFTFIVELFVPFLFFAPRRLRYLGGALTIALQALIILTGNYTFFNWLTIAICILLFDDAAFSRCFPRKIRDVPLPPPSVAKRIFAALLAVVLITVGGIRLLNLFDTRISPRTLPAPLQDVYRRASSLYLANGYGLFAVMTTTRPEIILEGSTDGETWLPYEFPYKAGDVDRSPVYVAPYQPRLDWQMWFAALGSYQNNPWFVSLVHRLLEGEPAVLALLAHNPFPDAPPTYIRAQFYQYRFTTAAERLETGAWWVREPAGAYLPAVSLYSFTATPRS